MQCSESSQVPTREEVMNVGKTSFVVSTCFSAFWHASRREPPVQGLGFNPINECQVKIVRALLESLIADSVIDYDRRLFSLIDQFAGSNIYMRRPCSFHSPLGKPSVATGARKLFLDFPF